MKKCPAFGIGEPADPERGNNPTHTRQGRPDPVPAHPTQSVRRRELHGPIVEIKAEQVDWGTDQLNGGRNGELREQDLEVLAGGDGVRDGGRDHGGETEGAEDGEGIAHQEGRVGGKGDGAADRAEDLALGRSSRGRGLGSRSGSGGVAVTEQLGEFDVLPDAHGRVDHKGAHERGHPCHGVVDVRVDLVQDGLCGIGGRKGGCVKRPDEQTGSRGQEGGRLCDGEPEVSAEGREHRLVVRRLLNDQSRW